MDKSPVSIGRTLKGGGGKRWRVVSVLGRGTCCWVYKVDLVGEEIKAALKVYNKGERYEAARSREELLLTTAKTAYGQLPELVRLYDSFTHRGHACLVQELCECDVRQLLYKQQSRTGLSMYLIQRLAKDVFRGLLPFHKKGFVHADIKPSNLLWSPESGCLKLLDFGLAFHVDDKVVGQVQSPGYRAPEIDKWNRIALSSDVHNPVPQSAKDELLRNLEGGATSSHTEGNGSQHQVQCDLPGASMVTGSPGLDRKTSLRSQYGVGTAADIWSVGCLLVEMFTGKKLFDPRTVEMLQSARGDQEGVVFLSSLLSQSLQQREGDDRVEDHTQLLARFRDFILKVLVTDPKHRISAESALQHKFFSHHIEPEFEDLLVLPTRVLRLLNVVDEKDFANEETRNDLLEDLQTELRKYGHVTRCVMPKEGPERGKVLVEYEHVHQAMASYQHLCRRTFSGRSILVTYFPLDMMDTASHC